MVEILSQILKNLPLCTQTQKKVQNCYTNKIGTKISSRYLLPGKAYQVYKCKCSFWWLFSKLKQMLQVQPSLHSTSRNLFCVGKQICNTTYVNNSKLKKSTPHTSVTVQRCYIRNRQIWGFPFKLVEEIQIYEPHIFC